MDLGLAGWKVLVTSSTTGIGAAIAELLIAEGFAVGTALAGGPPHRSQRALLTHWAPTLGTTVEPHVGPGVMIAGAREPGVGDAIHTLPGDVAALASTPKRLSPEPDHLGPEPPHRLAVGRHRVVGEVATHHGCQPCPLDIEG